MLIIGNGRMITRDASKAFIENGAVAMDGNTIVMVGTTDEVKKAYPDGEFVDARGGVIMPAFINTHEHIYSSFARGLSIKGYNPKGFLIFWMDSGGRLTAILHWSRPDFLQWLPISTASVMV